MVVDGLLIPDLLETMLAEERWPRTPDHASKPRLHSRLRGDHHRRLRNIDLYAPPLRTVAWIVAGAAPAWPTIRTAAVNEGKIEPRLKGMPGRLVESIGRHIPNAKN
jgi:hypothetical protein